VSSGATRKTFRGGVTLVQYNIYIR